MNTKLYNYNKHDQKETEKYSFWFLYNNQIYGIYLKYLWWRYGEQVPIEIHYKRFKADEKYCHPEWGTMNYLLKNILTCYIY